MTIEEIIKQEGRQPDCSGYVTKYDIECSDGLTIRPGAFNDDNGRKVPMVWMHDHKDMENVLGHIYLESRDDGVYGLGYFNDSPKGQLAKLYVDHGDISAFSIYANKLKKKARDVVHGMIREVSLVLAGANRGALIDSPLSHSEKDEDEGEGVICMGDDYGGPIYGNNEALSVEEYLEHYGRKGMKWGQNLFKTEYEAHPREIGEEEVSDNNRKDNARKKLKSLFGVLASEILRDAKSNEEGKLEYIAEDAYISKWGKKIAEAYKEVEDAYGVKAGSAEDRELMAAIEEDLNNAFSSNLPSGFSFDAKGVIDRIMEACAKDRGTSWSQKQQTNGPSETVKHSDEENREDTVMHTEGERTYLDVLKEMNDEQLSTVYYMLKKARKLLAEDAKAEHSDEGNEDEALEHSDEEDNEMKQNLFDTATENKDTTLSHDDMEKLEADVFRDAKSKGSLKDSFLAHAGDYGIDDIEYLFPDDRKVTNTPTWIKRPDGWVTKVMKGVSHSPFSRIKSMFADITEPDARARGYVKGNKKVEEVFGLLKRSTSPTTVYKKQKLDRDDIVDITDFDVVSWLKTEMRGMLDEELARAFLIGDGRSAASNDKINEQNIRPIYSDDDLFVIRKAIAVNSSTTTDAKCKEFIRQCIKARKDYRGSGNPTLYTTEDLLTDLLLMEDSLGHPLYDSQDKLATKLRVKEIVTVPVFENQTRTVGSATLELMGIIVNLDDYKVGADKGGSVSMFEDFDIDYNQEKYLIETRCSGALTVPYSAIVIESSSSVYLDVDPDDPTETRYGKTVSSLQENVVVNDDNISGTLKYVTGYTGFSGDTALQSGHYLALKLDVPNGATTTLQLLNNGGSGTPVDLGSDDYAVGYIRSKNAKIVVTTTLAGVSVSKTYSLRLLKLESAS